MIHYGAKTLSEIMCEILFLASLKFLPITAPPAGWEHQICHLARMTASIASDGRHMQARLVKSKKFRDWIRLIWRGPVAGSSEISSAQAPSRPCPALPACVLWNFNWIVNDTEEWHNTWETSKNQSGGALFLTVTKQKTLGNWQVQAVRPGQ